ncbi:MAG: AzlC family ABC transporter permease [Chloroflexi bacterium]|nr:AzlC family ABC transporter permease [Chloroflexota bacterium]
MSKWNERRSEFWNGVKDTFPLVVGAVPFGIIFGALAVTSNISPGGALAMSAIVFAGSAQFIAAGLVAGGAPLLIIVLTTFVVNMRHALYAASLAPHMKHLPQRWLAPLGFWLTDESFVVVIARYTKSDPSPYKHWYFLGSAVFMYANWQLCTVIGIVAGQAIPNPLAWGLDFALVVTFIGMLAQFVRNRPALAASIVAGICAVLANGLPNKMGLLLAAVLGIAAGVIAEALAPPAPVTPLDAGSDAAGGSR